MKLRMATVILESEVEPRQIGHAIFDYILEKNADGTFDDAGCDWYTDDDGNTYIAANPEWKPFRQDKEITALVDAANILILGYALKMPVEAENTYENEMASERYHAELVNAGILGA